MSAVDKLNKLCIEYIGFDPTNEEECLKKVKLVPAFIMYIKNPSIKVQIAAVIKDGHSIRYINNPSEEIQLAAVKENGYCFEYIEDPSEEVQLAAVKQYPISIKYIKNPSIEVQREAINSSKYHINIISLCPDKDKFAAEILNNIMIKDIIE